MKLSQEQEAALAQFRSNPSPQAKEEKKKRKIINKLLQSS